MVEMRIWVLAGNVPFALSVSLSLFLPSPAGLTAQGWCRQAVNLTHWAGSDQTPVPGEKILVEVITKKSAAELEDCGSQTNQQTERGKRVCPHNVLKREKSYFFAMRLRCWAPSVMYPAE
jgi:hypothetical protein